jgi:hypothetical protein
MNGREGNGWYIFGERVVEINDVILFIECEGSYFKY